MTVDDDELVRELQRRAPARVAVAPESSIAMCERDLDIRLPHLLRRIYAEVADGGIGPGYGLLPVTRGSTRTLAEVCSQFRAEGWPARLLPLWDWGDAVWSCVDVAGDAEVVTSDDVERTATGIRLGEWFAAWLRGEDLWKKIYADQVRTIVNPFTKKPIETLVRGKAIGRPWP